MKKEIIIPKPDNDSLVSQLKSLYYSLSGISLKDSVRFNLSELTWMCPLLVLPLSAFVNSAKNVDCEIGNENIKNYLKSIKFPEGIKNISELQYQKQTNKSYIPISIVNKEKKDSSNLETMFLNMISKYIEGVPGIKDALRYPVTELVGNIYEHSNKNEAFLFGQYYPKKKYLDVCIVDCGRGLAGAYKEEKNFNFSDEKAIEKAMKGISTKAYKDRGYGLHTSKDVVCHAAKGGFVMISGSAALISNSREEKLIKLPKFYWQGTIIAFRVPKPLRAVDIYPYLE